MLKDRCTSLEDLMLSEIEHIGMQMVLVSKAVLKPLR